MANQKSTKCAHIPCLCDVWNGEARESLDRELFGFENGAVSGKTGQLELADKGTLVLDEIAANPAGSSI